MPDFMYRAGVRCEGCHFDQGDARDVRSAGEISCMSCHGPAYRQIYQDWVKTIRQRTSALRRQFESTERLAGSRSLQALADAHANLELVEKGRGIHNYPYSIALLDASHVQLNDARKALGRPILSKPWAEAPYDSSCFDCHRGIEGKASVWSGRSFPHENHVVGREIRCDRCHSTHEERRSSGLPSLRLGADDCSSCHHVESDSGDCLDCHGKILEESFSTEKGDFDHALHVEMMELGCDSCHGDPPGGRLPADREACAPCHD